MYASNLIYYIYIAFTSLFQIFHGSCIAVIESMMKKASSISWIVFCISLIIYGFLKEFKPGGPFLFKYQIEFLNITGKQIISEVGLFFVLFNLCNFFFNMLSLIWISVIRKSVRGIFNFFFVRLKKKKN